jgi:hypothetical protein
MCEFCMLHGEGKLWYLQMKNCSQELIYTSLTAEQKQAVGSKTRVGWMKNFLMSTVLPASGGSYVETPQTETESVEIQTIPPSKADILNRQKMKHFGPILPIEDVEKVLSLTDSITRVPCACRFFEAGIANDRYYFGLGIDIAHIFGEYPERSASFEVLNRT